MKKGQRRGHRVWPAVLLLALLPAVLWAKPGGEGGAFRVIASVIGGGGGGWESRGGDFARPGTVGQPYGQTMRGGEFSLESGFWPIYCTPGGVAATPALTIARAADDVVLGWPAESANSAGTEIWRDSADPYFQPAYPPLETAYLPETAYADAGAIPGTAYYVATGNNKCSGRSAPSNRVGVFAFGLVPGS